MRPEVAFRYYTALRLHFTKEHYDFFKYRGHIGHAGGAFEKRHDQKFFAVLAKAPNVPSYLVANFAVKSYYVRDLVTLPECHQNYRDWKTRLESMEYHLSADLLKLGSFKDETNCKNLPRLVERYHRGEISKETLCLILHYGKLLPVWDEQLKDNIVWECLRVPIIKYVPFTKKSEKYARLIREKFPEIEYK